MNFESSKTEFDKANQYIPGGVNSPVRAFNSVKQTPVYIKSANGSTIEDIDGNTYTDFVASWGPLILGHAHPKIVEAIQGAAARGTSYGAPTIVETSVAATICSFVPSVDRVRMVNSGTEATMSAVRLARGYTSKEKIIKFAGCYHGHADSFLIKAGSGAITLGLPDSPGVTKGTAQDTLIAEYNNLTSVEKVIAANKDQIAALIIEPVAGNMGVVLPHLDFLKGVRELCTKNNIVLIFDEVITGFRLGKGGAQEHYGITPDLTTLGKIIGGGLPVGAYGGKKEIMDMLAPQGPVYQAGTLSGNPLAMAAGLAMLEEVNKPGFYEELNRKATLVEEGFRNNIKEAGIPAVLNRVGSMMTLFFTEEEKVNSFDTAMKSNTERYAKYFKLSLDSGIYIAPSQFEALFISGAHTDAHIEQLITANRNALKQL